MHYFYTAIDNTAKRITGEVDAESIKAAADILRAQSLLPIQIDEGSATQQRHRFDTQNVLGHVKLVDKVTFIKNLAVMLKSGFPMSRALTALAEQTQNTVLRAALKEIGSRVEAGQTLADSMEKYPKIFPSIMTSVVRVGEVSGTLETALLNLHTQLNKDYDLRRKTRGALIYPSVVVTIMVLVAIVMFTFVLPKLTKLFEDLEVELPFLTRMVIGLAAFMKSYGIFVLSGFVVLIVAFLFAMRNDKTKAVIDGLVLKAPIIGKVSQYTNLARFSITLNSLLHSGMPILESIRVTGKSLSNIGYRVAIEQSERLIRSGSTLSQALKNHPLLFPPLVVSMITVGEESGSIETVLQEISQFYEAEVDQMVTNLSSILEPFLMVIVGAAVAILALSMIMPLYSITQSI